MAAWAERLRGGAVAAALMLPVLTLHGRPLGEAAIALIDIVFLIRRGLARDWTFASGRWERIALTWWAWLVVCSLPGVGIGGWPSLLQAVLAGRFLVLVAALEHDILRTRQVRLWLCRVLAGCALWVAGSALLQAATGRNVAGFPPWGEGELTGPFEKPRAGLPLSRLLFPVTLPLLAHLLPRRAVTAVSVASLAIATMVLVGQRMPLLLTLLGLAVSALLLPRLRTVAAAALLAGSLVLAMTPLVAPRTFHRLAEKFTAQMTAFPASSYGLIAGRALAIAGDRPLFGAGFDGFRNACADPATWRATLPGQPADGGGADGCNIHPHNPYLHALTDGGIPGLLLFAALALAWLGRLAHTRTPLGVGLFIAALQWLWPLQSSTGLFAIESIGLSAVLLGLGLAQRRHAP